MEYLIFEHFLSYFGKISDRNFEYCAETRLTPAFSVMYIGDIFGRGPIKMLAQWTPLRSNSTFSRKRWI